MRAWLVLSLAVAACVPAAQRRLEDRALATLRDGLRARAPAVRLAAIRAAETLDEERLFEPVTRLLDDDDERVRAEAAGAVLRGHPDAPTVLTAALRSPDPVARGIAVRALGRKVGARAADDLRAALRDPDGAVRADAVVALGDGLDRAELRRLAGSDAYLGARLAAVRALGRLGDRDALRPLAADPDPLVALRAAVLVGAPEPALAVAARAADWPVRAAAANAIAGGHGREVLALLAADPEPAVRLAAARALLRTGCPADALPLLEAALALPDGRLRVDAAADLARLGDPRGPAALAALAADPDPAVDGAALAAIPGVTDAHVAALDAADRGLRVAVALLILERIR